MCRRCDVPTDRLVLEITEGMVVADPARALPVLDSFSRALPAAQFTAWLAARQRDAVAIGA
jgi:EAL domain-containing protein (putative c-di-GMP-specific phosphodiesterase class I)